LTRDLLAAEWLDRPIPPPPRALFGLGDDKGPVSVEVRLGDERWQWAGVPVDRYTVLSIH